jgi:hypothetical protein
MSKKNVEFKPGDQVIACPTTMACPKKSSKLMSRTGLSSDELKQPMHVIRANDDGQIHVKHSKIKQPFIVHKKYMAPMSVATA